MHSKVRLKDIAEAANVSIATISMSLADHPNVNSETKRRIRNICDQLGYSRKRKPLYLSTPRPNKSLQFGYLLLGNRLDDDSKMVLAHALTFGASKLGVRFEMTGIEKDYDSPATLSQILSFARNLDGLILTGLIPPSVLTELGNLKVPSILIGHFAEEQEESIPQNCEMIAYDCIQMGKIATEYLLHRGHTRIGFVSEIIPKGMVHDRWLAGYQLALLRAGIRTQPDWLHVAGAKLVGGKPAADAMARMTSPPTAYVIPDVRIAASFISAMRDHGHHLTQDSLVIGGEREIAHAYHLESLPMLSIDMTHLANICLHRLQYLCLNGKEYPYSIAAPFMSFNFNPVGN